MISGGANRGAYEAGAIHGLSNLLNGTDAYYDVVTGVSTGSLNTAALSMWAPNQAKPMAGLLISGDLSPEILSSRSGPVVYWRDSIINLECPIPHLS